MEKYHSHKVSEAGNVLFIILLAAGLFASLSYTISKSNRGGGDIDRTRARVTANDIITYGGSIASAIEQLRQEGTSENALSFAHPQLSSDYGVVGAEPSAEIFNTRGGGITFRTPGGATTPNNPIFSSTNDVRNVGSRCVGAACSNCSVSGASSCVDIVMFLEINSQDVCTGINDILGIGEEVENLAFQDGTFDDTPFDGDFAFQRAVQSTGATNIFNAKRTGCFEGSGSQAGSFYFYYVLLAR